MAPTPSATRLTVVYYNHTGDVSGAEISLLTLMTGIRDQVNVVLVAPEGELLERARQEGIQVIALRPITARMSTNPLKIARGTWDIFRTSLELRKVVSRLSADVIHANSIRAGLACLLLPKQVPQLWHVRDALPKNLVGWAIRRLASRMGVHVVAISQAIANDFRAGSWYEGEINVIYNAVTLDELSRGDLRAELGVAPDAFVVGMVGQITPWKRQHDAIEAFELFHRDYPDSELWVVGAPKFRPENVKYEAYLKRLVSEKGLSRYVRFLGFRQDVAGVMRAVNVLVVPSDNEPFGRVIVEAMLAERPVIGTRGGGIPEIIEDGVNGFLVAIGDVQAIADRLRALANDPERLKTMGRIGREQSLQRFAPEAHAATFRSVYVSILGSSMQLTTLETRPF